MLSHAVPCDTEVNVKEPPASATTDFQHPVTVAEAAFAPKDQDTEYVARLAEQFAEFPQFTPEHVQFQGPAPVTVEGDPLVQRFDDGEEVKVAQ